MRKVLGLSLALVVALTTMASGKPVDKASALRAELPNLGIEQQASGSASLSSHIYVDTISYGGTTWDAVDGRWEAIRDSHWGFATGIATSINTGTNVNKPVGYHQTFEGWYGIDQTLNPMTFFRVTTLCAIAGSYSLHAGVDATEATALCYVAGAGYGNDWSMTVSKTFAYAGSGDVTLTYQYAVDAEPGFDYAYVAIDTSGTGADADILLVDYTGVVSGNGNLSLTEGATMRVGAGNFVLKFIAGSDGAYSDEDGAYPSVCGHSTFDNITLSGGTVDATTFEGNNANGWAIEIPTTGIGDFSNVMALTDLPPPVAFCPCGLRDSVLVFFDDTFDGHPLDQDNLAASPWIDLQAGGDAGKPGKLMLYDVYAEMPLANYIFVNLRARYYPWTCPVNGFVGTSPWKDQNTVFYFGEVPFCNPFSAPRLRDYSAVIDAGAEEVQVGFGMLSLCRTAPFGVDCSGLTNTTPWMDNISLGVYGANTAPNVQTTTFDRFQDNFSADGTLNPGSPGRLDVNRIKNGSTPSTGTILGDTLTARGDGGNTEVRLVFRVDAGPFVNGAALAGMAARWTSEPTLNARYGGTWYSARMDSAEQGGNTSAAIWMTTFHEADAGFIGPDNAPDPNDPNRGPRNDILPDHIFTPGSRIDYFVTSHYIPPDPRNPGGTAWYTDPDTLRANFREVEILPSSMAADSSWNCTLYVDHHDDRNLFDQQLEEQGLRLSMPGAGNNAEGTRHDRFDNQTPSSGQLSFGRPLETNYGASQTQVFAYKNIAWHGATLSSFQLTDQDAAILNPWLRNRAVGDNRLWVSGSGMATSMHNLGTGTPGRVFLNSTMGATRTCDTIRLANCPAGTPQDTTYCLPMVQAAPNHFVATALPRGRGNGCPDLESFDLLGINAGSVATARGNLSYTAKAATRNYESVSNWNTVDVDFKTVIDGTAVGRMRANPGYFNFGCNDVSASYTRTDDVLDWFASALSCKLPASLVDVQLPEGPRPPAFRHALGNAYPNPMNPSTSIQFTNGVNNGRVTLQIFDVTGRLVKTLVDGKLDAGAHEVSWDGSDNAGSSAPNGMYFYRMTADNFVSAKKIVMMRQ